MEWKGVARLPIARIMVSARSGCQLEHRTLSAPKHSQAPLLPATPIKANPTAPIRCAGVATYAIGPWWER